jgi:hypothetical protein
MHDMNFYAWRQAYKSGLIARVLRRVADFVNMASVL